MKILFLIVATILVFNVHLAKLEQAKAETAQPQEQNKAASSALTSKEAQNLADNVLRETSAVRGLTIKRKVLCGVQSPAQIQAMLKKNMAKSVATNELKAANIYFKQLKLAPDDFNLPDYYLQMMSEQLAGYYDTRTQQFHTTSRVDRLQLQTVMAHELTHALQDQHFGLAKLEKWPKHDSDARLAMQALVEGDATLAMTQYTARNPLRALALLASSAMSADASKTFLAAPSVLQESLTFPYIKGLLFASALHARGGWTEINQAYKNLPASTEQILHPEKYFARELPAKVPFRDLSPSLGKDWKLLDHDVNGEFGLQIVLQEHLKEISESAEAASGWAGDRYAIYQGPKGASLVAQVTIWDNESEAGQFTQAYIRHANLRTKTKALYQKGALLWKAGINQIWLQRRGAKVIILEAKSLPHTPARIAARLW